MLSRAVRVIRHPRHTMAAVAGRPTWISVGLAVSIIWLGCGVWLLSTAVGRQAIVDERVRLTEAFGGEVDDEGYAAMQARPPWTVYLLSGSRLLLAPPITLLIAVAVYYVARARHPAVTWGQALGVTVHASIVLALGQLVATPLHYVRESVTNPVSLLALVPVADAGTFTGRVLRSMDLFTLWWAWLLGLGIGSIANAPARHWSARVLAVYVIVAIILAVLQRASGGS